MNVGSIKTKIRRLLASLHSVFPTDTNSDTCEQCWPLLNINEETEEQDKLLNDFSLKNTKN